MILSTDSIPHGRYEGILASLMLYGTYREGLRSVTWSAVGRGNIGQDTDIDATAVDKAVLFWSHFSSIPTAVNDWVWNLPDSELRQWSSKLVSLDIRWLQSLDAGETSRPLLSEPEIHEIATRISESLSPLSHSIAISENASRFLNEHSFLTELLKEAQEVLRSFFPRESLRLEHRIDPELPDDEKLTLYVQADTPVEETLVKLDEFEEFWWLDNLHKANDRMLIDVEFL